MCGEKKNRTFIYAPAPHDVSGAISECYTNACEISTESGHRQNYMRLRINDNCMSVCFKKKKVRWEKKILRITFGNDENEFSG